MAETPPCDCASEVGVPHVFDDVVSQFSGVKQLLITVAVDGDDDGDVIGLLAVLDVYVDDGDHVVRDVVVVRWRRWGLRLGLAEAHRQGRRRLCGCNDLLLDSSYSSTVPLLFWDSILHDSAFLEEHAGVTSNRPVLVMMDKYPQENFLQAVNS
uniref:Uncharacterized protein n=1 Tax=Leersia perrieri TaxID=77586 RepID=A0A0D9WE69_9ORYZ